MSTVPGPWSPVAPCTPQACVAGVAARVGPVRRVARYAAVACVVTAGVALVPLVRGCGARRREALVRAWARVAVAAFGVRAVLTSAIGPPAAGAAAVSGAAGTRGRGVLVVANHVSWLDILLVAAVRPGRMLAKSEVRRWPVFGPIAARGGTLFIERDRLRALPGTVAQIAAALRRGATVVAFPEGSTWCGRRQGRFRPAVFQAALDAGVPVQPIAVRYHLRDGTPTTAAAFVGADTLFASLRRVASARGLVAEVCLGPEIPAGAYTDRRRLAVAAQTAAVPGARGRGPAGSGVGPLDPALLDELRRRTSRIPSEGVSAPAEAERWTHLGQERGFPRLPLRPVEYGPAERGSG